MFFFIFFIRKLLTSITLFRTEYSKLRKEYVITCRKNTNDINYLPQNADENRQKRFLVVKLICLTRCGDNNIRNILETYFTGEMRNAVDSSNQLTSD